VKKRAILSNRATFVACDNVLCDFVATVVWTGPTRKRDVRTNDRLFGSQLLYWNSIPHFRQTVTKINRLTDSIGLLLRLL